MTDLTTQDKPPKPKKLKPKQKQTIEYWLNRESETFGNLYRSAVKAGFRPSYALNLTSLKPSWLYETVEATLKLEQDHIVQGVQHIALNTYNEKDARSPADTRLKALELLGNWSGLNPQNKGNTTNVIVQPILSGESVRKQVKVETTEEQADKGVLPDNGS